jgi:type I restriction enzyme S subunit
MKKYASYKDSGIEWIGEIPEHWRIKKLKNNAKIKTGYTPLTSDNNNFSNDGMIWVKPDNLKSFEFITDSKEKVSALGVKEQNIISQGSILLCCIGTIGKFGIAGTNLITNQQINSVTFGNDLINEYGKYLIFSCEKELNSLANGNVVRILNTTSLGNIKFPIPPFSEQEYIFNYLDRKTSEIEILISNKQRLIELLKEERTVIINNAVTKGINPDVKFKPSGIEWIGDVPEHWEVIPVKYLGTTQNGISEGAEYFGSGFPFVSYGDVYKNMELPKIVQGLANSTEKDKLNFSVQKGDVFFTRTSETIEEIGLASTCFETIDNAVFAGFLIRFRPIKNLLFEGFSKYYFRSEIHRTFFIKEMNIVTRASLSQGLLKRLLVLLPDLKEQKEISDFLDVKTKGIDTIISKTEKEIELLNEYKTALISEVVTGKVDVREEVLASAL